MEVIRLSGRLASSYNSLQHNNPAVFLWIQAKKNPFWDEWFLPVVQGRRELQTTRVRMTSVPSLGWLIFGFLLWHMFPALVLLYFTPFMAPSPDMDYLSHADHMPLITSIFTFPYLVMLGQVA